jgi:hypothetical protein
MFAGSFGRIRRFSRLAPPPQSSCRCRLDPNRYQRNTEKAAFRRSFCLLRATVTPVGPVPVPSVRTIAVSAVRENVAVTVEARETAIRVPKIRTAVIVGWRPLIPATTPTHLHGVGLFVPGFAAAESRGRVLKSREVRFAPGATEILRRRVMSRRS